MPSFVKSMEQKYKNKNIAIKKAGPEDVHDVSAILSEAARYLESIGQPLWKCDDLTPEGIFADVVDGQYYIAHVAGEPVGTFKYQLEDRQFWPDINNEKSAFVHRLAVKRKVASMGVAQQMLDWAKVHTKSIGRDYLRLDCAMRPKLCAVYEKNGFVKHSERQVGPYYVARYECYVRSCDQGSAPDALTGTGDL